MCKYRLTQLGDGLRLTNEHGLEVNIVDILRVYPERRVYAFYGQMGAGKTTLIKELCKQMGVQDVVNSPTFAIVNVYDIDDKDSFTDEIYHFDCYRLKSVQEALDFGAEEYLYSGNYCFIEWPEMIEQILPEDMVKIYITPISTDEIGENDSIDRELIIK